MQNSPEKQPGFHRLRMHEAESLWIFNSSHVKIYGVLILDIHDFWLLYLNNWDSWHSVCSKFLDLKSIQMFSPLTSMDFQIPGYILRAFLNLYVSFLAIVRLSSTERDRVCVMPSYMPGSSSPCSSRFGILPHPSISTAGHMPKWTIRSTEVNVLFRWLRHSADMSTIKQREGWRSWRQNGGGGRREMGMVLYHWYTFVSHILANTDGSSHDTELADGNYPDNRIHKF